MAQAYALGLLPEQELAAFEARVRGSRELRQLVYEYQALLEQDASSMEQEPSFEVYAGAMARIEAMDEPAETTGKGAGRTFYRPLLSWSGWAAAAGIALALSAGWIGHEKQSAESDIVLNELGNPIVKVPTPRAEFELEDRMLELANLAEAFWFSREGVPSGQLLGEEEPGAQKFTAGFTIFDRKHNIGFIAVENLPSEALEKSYHVWARVRDGIPPVRAGTLPVGEESRGLFFFDLSGLPAGADLQALSFFVTEEESDEPIRPSEVVVLSDV